MLHWIVKGNYNFFLQFYAQLNAVDGSFSNKISGLLIFGPVLQVLSSRKTHSVTHWDTASYPQARYIGRWYLSIFDEVKLPTSIVALWHKPSGWPVRHHRPLLYDLWHCTMCTSFLFCSLNSVHCRLQHALYTTHWTLHYILICSLYCIVHYSLYTLSN